MNAANIHINYYEVNDTINTNIRYSISCSLHAKFCDASFLINLMNYWWIRLCTLCFEGVTHLTHTHPWEKDKKPVKFHTAHFEEEQDKNVLRSITHTFFLGDILNYAIYIKITFFLFQIILPLVTCFFPHCPVLGRYPRTNKLAHVSFFLLSYLVHSGPSCMTKTVK